MLIALTGLHASGKSYFANNIPVKYGFKVYNKKEVVKYICKEETGREDWAEWYREEFNKDPYNMTKMILEYINLDLVNFINENINDKSIINQICNYFENKNHNPEELKEFDNILKNGSLIQIYNSLSNLTYYSKRLLKGYIYNKIICKNRTKKLELK